jgi:hypothetical protein
VRGPQPVAGAAAQALPTVDGSTSLDRRTPAAIACPAMPLFGRSDKSGNDAGVEESGSTAGGHAIGLALERFAALPVAERAAEVFAVIGPAITAAWDAVDWGGWELPKGTSMERLLEPLIPQFRSKELSPEDRKNLALLRVTLAEAFQALVLARMLIRQDPSGSLYSEGSYANSSDGLEALERGDVAAVVARRLPT